MDEVIFEEFKGTGNLEVVLDRKLVDKRSLAGHRHQSQRHSPRRNAARPGRVPPRSAFFAACLNDMNPTEAMELLVTRLGKTKSNAEFLMSMKS